MQFRFCGFVIMILALILAGNAVSAATLETDQQKYSYAIGVQVAGSMKREGLKLDAAALSQAISDVLTGSDLKMTADEMRDVFMQMQQQQAHEMEALAEQNLQQGQAFLAKNKSKKGVIELDNGMQYKVLTVGQGKQPTASDTVEVHYRGTLIDGKEFDSSYRRGKPAVFPVNGVIKGWQEILPMMKEGAKWQVYIPSSLAYGARGTNGAIGPNATLIFDIELIAVK